MNDDDFSPVSSRFDAAIGVSSPSPPTSSGSVFQLVRTGRARTRADIARHTGSSPSTVALRVEQLIRAGYLDETSDGASRGGRPPRMLEITDAPEVVAGIDLGENHAVVALLNRRSELISRSEIGISLSHGALPDATLRELVHAAGDLTERQRAKRILVGIGLSVPGPIDSRTGRLLSPTRMPGWNGVDVRERLSAIAKLPAMIENDANCMALGERSARPESHSIIFVKAGSGIGCGTVIDGRLFTGYRGVAGDISHTTVAEAPSIRCSCGRVGCLDVVASGQAIVESLKERGEEVSNLAEALQLAERGHVHAGEVFWEAGRRLGEVLSTIVNFSNPEVIALGGQLSTASPFTAGLRQAIYTLCPPMTTDLLTIDTALAGPDAAALGIGVQLMGAMLTAEEIDSALRTSD